MAAIHASVAAATFSLGPAAVTDGKQRIRNDVSMAKIQFIADLLDESASFQEGARVHPPGVVLRRQHSPIASRWKVALGPQPIPHRPRPRSRLGRAGVRPSGTGIELMHSGQLPDTRVHAVVSVRRTPKLRGRAVSSRVPWSAGLGDAFSEGHELLPDAHAFTPYAEDHQVFACQ